MLISQLITRVHKYVGNKHTKAKTYNNYEYSRYLTFFNCSLTHDEILWFTLRGLYYENHGVGVVKCFSCFACVTCDFSPESLRWLMVRLGSLHSSNCMYPSLDRPMSSTQRQTLKARRDRYIREHYDNHARAIEHLEREQEASVSSVDVVVDSGWDVGLPVVDSETQRRDEQNEYEYEDIDLNEIMYEHRASSSSSSSASSSATLDEMSTLELRGVKTTTTLQHRSAMYSDYQTLDARLRTFQHWPIGLTQTKDAMASAGFFYSGVGDMVTCFHCGLERNNWTRDEMPKETHARLAGEQCYYAKIMWGPRFIKSVSDEGGLF